MMRTVTGPFQSSRFDRGVWELRTPATQLFLRGVDASSGSDLSAVGLHQLELAWVADGVRVTATRASGRRSFPARTAILHEPDRRLYDPLPLAAFDADAQRFWHRVFRLIRIPGGRFLLKLVARRRR